ncbi:MAG: hypothetical protein U9R08_06090 [Nanoarchaeota archaeon]|nr:hypothetical protein [Nanoarchaeota archaeon]
MHNKIVYSIIIFSVITLTIIALSSPTRSESPEIKEHIKVVKDKTLSLIDYIGLGGSIGIGIIMIGSFLKWTKE